MLQIEQKWTIEHDETYQGYRLVVVKAPDTPYRKGHRCGYVGINKDHPLFGVDYMDETPVLQDMADELHNKPLGDRGIMTLFCAALSDSLPASPGLVFDVHGSITYSNSHLSALGHEGDNLWWFGFDCNHHNDSPDQWTSAVVLTETRRLADQLAYVQEKERNS